MNMWDNKSLNCRHLGEKNDFVFEGRESPSESGKEEVCDPKDVSCKERARLREELGGDDDWGALDGAAAQKEREAAGQEKPDERYKKPLPKPEPPIAPPVPRRPDETPRIKEKPIDPEDKALMAEIRDRMDKIYYEIFNPTDEALDEDKLDPEKTAKYRAMVETLKESILMKGIIHNRSKDEICDTYKKELTIWKKELIKRSWPKRAWDGLKGMFTGAFDSEHGRALQGPNPNLESGAARPLRLKDKREISSRLGELENYFMEEIKKEYSGNIWDDFNKDALTFVKNELLPFYREYYVNRAIIERWTPKTLIKEYGILAAVLFSNCITDSDDRSEQKESYLTKIREWSDPSQRGRWDRWRDNESEVAKEFKRIHGELGKLKNPSVSDGDQPIPSGLEELVDKQEAMFDLSAFGEEESLQDKVEKLRRAKELIDKIRGTK